MATTAPRLGEATTSIRGEIQSSNTERHELAKQLTVSGAQNSHAALTVRQRSAGPIQSWDITPSCQGSSNDAREGQEKGNEW